jgi:3D (Asp-Asp-Asp) domain-containing protein
MLLSVALTLGSVATGGERRPDQGPHTSLLGAGQQRAGQAASKRFQVTVGAYSPRRQETQGNPRDTASGEQVRPGIVALSPDVEHALGVTFGDRIVLEGLGTFVFQDRVAARKKHRVDIFMESTGAARQFGKRRAFVTVAGKE